MLDLRSIYRKLDRVQRDRRFKWIATVAALLVVGMLFGSLLRTNYDLESQRTALTAALASQSLSEGDPLAVSFAETGTVTLNGRTYGDERYRAIAQRYFDDSGAIASPAALARDLVAPLAPQWAPRWLLLQPGTTWMLTAIVLAWLLLVIWLEISLPLLLTLLITGVPVLFGYLTGRIQVMLYFGGIGLLAFTFIMLMRALLVLFNPAHPLLAVAHNVVKEASRTRIGIAFITILLVLLPLLPLDIPLLPFSLDPDDPLQYRMQTFLSWSLGLTFILAACMTLFLSCATVAFEIRDRQIWHVVSKPVYRAQYLLGKWLGVAAVNLVILLIAGVCSFTFIKYLSTTGASGFTDREIRDRIAVEDEVLTARLPAYPDYPEMSAEQITAWVDDYIESDPELSRLESIPPAERRKLRSQVSEAFAARQRAVPAQRARSFTFHDLSPARQRGSTLTFKYMFHMIQDDEHEVFPARFMLNEDTNTIMRRSYVPTVMHAMPIVPEFVQDNGDLTITIFNDAPIGELNWDHHRFLILYKVASFEGNFFRALLAMWIKLIFLAALAVSAATFLSFPVACMLSFTVFFAGMLGPYLAQSLEFFVPPATEQVDWSNFNMVLFWAVTSFVRFVAQIIVFLLRGFGDLQPTNALVEGRYISWSLLGGGLVKLGFLWSGLAMVVGWLVIPSRQLVIYSGHG